MVLVVVDTQNDNDNDDDDKRRKGEEDDVFDCCSFSLPSIEDDCLWLLSNKQRERERDAKEEEEKEEGTEIDHDLISKNKIRKQTKKGVWTNQTSFAFSQFSYILLNWIICTNSLFSLSLDNISF